MDEAPETREVEMKKSIFFILLASFLGACSTQLPVVSSTPALLSFNDLATEITVGYQAHDATTVDNDQDNVDTP